MLAVESKQPKIVEFLLKCKGVDVAAKNASDLTALEMAKTSKEKAIVEMFLDSKKMGDEVDDRVVALSEKLEAGCRT